MTSTAAPFVPLGTKLNVPRSARHRVVRTELVDRLVSARPRRLTLLSAPAGWGKTTLLAEWTADPRETRPFAWVTLDRGDNDPVRFWGYVIEALRSVEPSVGEQSLALLGVSGTDPSEIFLPTLINELAGLDRGILLALEDYHVITSPDIHTGVNLLLDHLTTSVELVLATRLDPPLPLARLRASGDLLELRASDLRFDDAEAASLLTTALEHDELAPDDVSRLVRRTEGWAAGLYLAALSLSGRTDASAFIADFAGDDRHIVDYLGGEVLDGLPSETRAFLLRTSVLDRLSASLCDHLLETGDAGDRLLEIERANLFLVPLDDRREWYRYHHLFGDLLRHELGRSEPSAVPRLHRRAAEWLAANGAVDDAIRHALAAGDGEYAAELVAASWREPFNRGELGTVDRWLDDLPEALVHASPDLRIARAWVLMDRGRPREAEQWLPGVDAVPEGLVLHAVLCFKLGKLAHAKEIAARALEQASADSPLAQPVAHCILGIVSYFRGELPAAEASLQEAARIAVAERNELARIYALGYLGLVRLAAMDQDGARAVTQEACARASRPPTSEHFVTAMALLAQARLDADDAVAEQAVALARRGAAALEIALALTTLGTLRRDPATLREARDEIAACEDAGQLPEDITAAEVALRGRAPGSRRKLAGDLSDRELAVLRLLPSDASLREVAASLYLSLNTVKTHVRSIYRKLGASTREEAVERGRELGLL